MGSVTPVKTERSLSQEPLIAITHLVNLSTCECMAICVLLQILQYDSILRMCTAMLVSSTNVAVSSYCLQNGCPVSGTQTSLRWSHCLRMWLKMSTTLSSTHRPCAGHSVCSLPGPRGKRDQLGKVGNVWDCDRSSLNSYFVCMGLVKQGSK